MSIARRAAAFNPATETLMWQDSGPGTWVFERTATGIITVTFPETFLDTNYVVLISPNFQNVDPPQAGLYVYTIDLTTTQCTVRMSLSTGAAFNAGFTIEIVGEVA